MELQQQIASLTMQIQALKAASDEAQLKVENLKQAYKEAEKGTYEAQDTFRRFIQRAGGGSGSDRKSEEPA